MRTFRVRGLLRMRILISSMYGYVRVRVVHFELAYDRRSIHSFKNCNKMKRIACSKRPQIDALFRTRQYITRLVFLIPPPNALEFSCIMGLPEQRRLTGFPEPFCKCSVTPESVKVLLTRSVSNTTLPYPRNLRHGHSLSSANVLWNVDLIEKRMNERTHKDRINSCHRV
jgi:hypothetical protein